MSLPDLLDEATLRAELERLPEWRRDGSALLRSFSFPDFVTAFAFMTRVADLAEAAQHHPEWSNVYGRVEIRLTTHDAGGLTANDVSLARAIDAVAS